MLDKIASIAQFLQKSVLNHARICMLCQQYHRTNAVICDDCRQYLTPLGRRCYYCATLLAENHTTSNVCDSCAQETHVIDAIITAYRYEEPLKTLLHLFKYQQGLDLKTLLVSLMLEAPFEHRHTECLIPIPMHRQRLRQRGFNQAAILARCLSRQIKVPCLLYACQKIRKTLPQARLSLHQRQHNLKDAFKVQTIPHNRITLIDDLYTTGSTTREIASSFKAQGVEQVDVWCCARAILS